MAKRVVLAYSGGLDTSVLVRWMQEEMGVEEVFCLCADVGQATTGDWDAVRERAFAAGAADIEVRDLREEFADEILTPALKANAKYEGKYPLVSALSRPIIAKHLVLAARQWGADSVAHGCTGKGNDQVRFEVSVRALAPDLEVLAPVRHWGFTREDSILYAYRHNIPITATKEKLYSIDDNLWGRAIECGEMEDPWAAPPPGVWAMTMPTATEPREVVVAFEEGKPVALDGAAMPLHELIGQMNGIVGAYGWGRLDMVENRRVGIKSRETYECPAALALLLAHADLEDITLEARRPPREDTSRVEVRRARLRRAVVLAAEAGVRCVRGRDATLRDGGGPAAARARALLRERAAQPSLALRLRPRDLRRRRHVPAHRLRGLRSHLGPRRADVGTAPVRWPRVVTLWHGRFGAGPADELLAFTASLPFDQRLAADDIAARAAHVRGLVRAGLLDGDEAAAILAALDAVADELAAGTLDFAPSDEDIHTAIERRVTEIAGAAGGKLHTGRSRNDQVATALRLWCKRELPCRRGAGHRVYSRCCSIGRRAGDAYLPGYTHVQRAQPVLLAHHLLAHGWALARDVDRLLATIERLDVSPLGAGRSPGRRCRSIRMARQSTSGSPQRSRTRSTR